MSLTVLLDTVLLKAYLLTDGNLVMPFLQVTHRRTQAHGHIGTRARRHVTTGDPATRMSTPVSPPPFRSA